MLEKDWFAHIAEDGRKQNVQEHLIGVAELASEFAAKFASAEHGYAVGIIHDIGKGTEGFQQRLSGGPIVDHSTAGAMILAKNNSLLSAACVAGHHGGLLDIGNPKTDTKDDETFCGRIKRAINGSIEVPQMETPSFKIPPEPTFNRNMFAYTMWGRMLYSCLVDADFLDTERFMLGKDIRPKYDSIEFLLKKLNEYIKPWENPKTDINKLRCQVLKQCIDAAESENHLFTLTVPTGGGKTTSSLAFALNHAAKHKKDRIIYIVPYTSIIDQNADVFKKILGEKNVLEHHSGVDFGVDNDGLVQNNRKLLATENWDAPVIVTTAVQFFESCLSNKPSKCRKLHNIANSVIIFDEAQMIPSEHLKPCCAIIATLANYMNVTAMLCTATQPSINDLLKDYAPDYTPEEVCRDISELFRRLKRNSIVDIGKQTTKSLADQLKQHKQVLCIVNTRKLANELYAEVKADTYHLSTLMTPQHRKAVIAEIKRRLSSGQPCRVISTSLIEAGVDIDFPIVYRERAGLDSIQQAAGRCNREGERDPSLSLVYVFTSDTKIPPLFAINVGATNEALAVGMLPDDLGAIERYFKAFRSLAGDAIDKYKVVETMTVGIAGSRFPYKTVAETFKLINNNMHTVYIRTKDSAECIDRIISHVATREDYRRAGNYSVNIYQQHYEALIASGEVIKIDEYSGYLQNDTAYSSHTGLSLKADSGRAEFI